MSVIRSGGRIFKNFTYNQLEELMSGYGEIDILWLDGGWVAPSRQDIDMDKIAGMARKYQNDLIIVDRTIRGKYEKFIRHPSVPFLWSNYRIHGRAAYR